ncbi:MAG: hypothetical protein ABFD92_21005 [Planctomycetaceae bacterium]
MTSLDYLKPLLIQALRHARYWMRKHDAGTAAGGVADDDGGGTVNTLQICGLAVSVAIFAAIGLAFIFGSCRLSGDADDEADRQLEEMRK